MADLVKLAARLNDLRARRAYLEVRLGSTTLETRLTDIREWKREHARVGVLILRLEGRLK